MQVIKTASHIRKLIAATDGESLWLNNHLDTSRSYRIMNGEIGSFPESIQTLSAREDIKPIYEGDEITVIF